ncbi:hypothetical protein P7K49_003378, partial [Saguinus oedipus]
MASSRGQFGRLCSTATPNTKLSGPDALLNRQSEIWKADWNVHLIEWDLDNEPDQEIPEKQYLSR